MRDCNQNNCPKWTLWSEWSSCSYSCGGGTCTRTRKCQLPDKTNVPSQQCTEGSPSETKQCNEQPCPELGPWSEWSSCSLSCGGGTQTRNRKCGLPSLTRNDNPCKAPLDEQRQCNELACPEFGPWSPWSPCSVTCGGGNQTRTRQCVPADDPVLAARIKELYCDGKSLQSQVYLSSTFLYVLGCKMNEKGSKINPKWS